MTTTEKCPDCGEQHRDRCWCLKFPGWKPESGDTKFGHPLPTLMQVLSTDEVRQWGKEALDMLLCLAIIEQDEIPEDPDWMVDARYWAYGVLTEVENIIRHDPVLQEYEAFLTRELRSRKTPDEVELDHIVWDTWTEVCEANVATETFNKE